MKMKEKEKQTTNRDLSELGRASKKYNL